MLSIHFFFRICFFPSEHCNIEFYDGTDLLRNEFFNFLGVHSTPCIHSARQVTEHPFLGL